MAKEKGKKEGHKCPPIPEGFTRKMTGPEWTGQSFEKSRRMWFDWLRDLDKYVKPMPRRTH